MTDEWSGFADWMASLIEKYAADLDLDNLPDPKTVPNQQDDVSMSEKIIEPCIAGKKLHDIIIVKKVSKLSSRRENLLELRYIRLTG